MTAYFDNAATTKPCPEAVEAVTRALTEVYGNPSSGHALGRAAAKLMEDARSEAARVLGSTLEEVYFTSGGTEGDNWAIRSVVRARRHRGRHIVTSLVEHDAVRQTVKRLEAEGCNVTWLRPDENGAVSPDVVREALREDTVLVSLMLVNNETGAVTDIGAVSRLVHDAVPDALVHCDAVQGLLKVPFTVKTLGADLVTVSSHKIHGPKGAGALYIRKGLRPEGLLTGGGQERGLRPGTEPVPAIAGFGAALRTGRERFPESVQRMETVRARLTEGLSAAFDSVVFIGGGAPHILSFSLPGHRSEVLMNVLDAAGVAVSKSSACKKGARSHVLEAMGLPAEVIDGAIRVSLSRYSTEEEADYFVETLRNAARRLRTRK